MKRVKIVPDRPNRLFELWLEEWKDDAAHRNSDLCHHFAKALDSLKKYPLPLESGRECIILRHFGVKLCLMLDRKLKEYKRQESSNAVHAALRVSGAVDDEKHAIVSRKKSLSEKIKIVAIQERAVAEKRIKNVKRNVPKELVSTNERIYLEPDTFDIVLLMDTQETCG